MRHFATALLIAAFISLTGCSRAPFIPYHSTAAIPHHSTSQMTAMTFIGGDEKMMSTRKYGVMWAVDDDSTPYVLVAPKRVNAYAARGLEEVNVGRGAPVSPERATELLAGLEQVLSTWDRPLEGGQGFFYEFTYAPEQDIVPVSASVVEWRPALKFNYSHTEKGPAALLRIGGGDTALVSVIDLRKREQVEDFRNLLRTSLDRLPAAVPPSTY